MTRSITIEDLYQFKILSRPRMSPDGQRVAFVVTTIDERNHAYRNAIWVIPAHGGEARRFTGSSTNAHSPAWSPDGRWLAFVSDREGEPLGKDATREQKASKGKPQIWLMPADGRSGLAGLDLEALGVPASRELIERYCRAMGWDGVPDLSWYFAFNLFRLAGIMQGIARRMLDGTAVSDEAERLAAQTLPVANAAWDFARKAGAS